MLPTVLLTATNFPFSHPIDLSWTITGIIGCAALFSPIAVALINNHHAYKMRKLDIAHEERKTQMALAHEAAQKQFEVYYADKRIAFSTLLKEAGNFSTHKQDLDDYSSLHSAVDNAILFCNSDTQKFLISFIERIDEEIFGGSYTDRERTVYTSLITALGHQLNKELASTKPTEPFGKCE